MNSPSTTAKKDKAESLHPRNPEPEPENETIIENTVKLKFKKRLTFQNQLFESRNDRVNVPVPDPGQPQHCGARVRESGTGTREISMILIFAFPPTFLQTSLSSFTTISYLSEPSLNKNSEL